VWVLTLSVNQIPVGNPTQSARITAAIPKAKHEKIGPISSSEDNERPVALHQVQSKMIITPMPIKNCTQIIMVSAYSWGTCDGSELPHYQFLQNDR
jgi:hypothetical protein